jgi:hypothetical protein
MHLAALYVNDISHDRILKFTSNSIFILSWGSIGSGDGQFKHPHGNEIDNEGNVYIRNQNNFRI